MDTKQLKERYGWSKDLENQIISLNKQLKEDYRGSLKLKKLKGKYYWYYQLSARVKSREKYLCSV